MTRKAKPAPISLRAYATRRGVSPEAVSKAVAAGRLLKSVVRIKGAPKIADPELADREWEEHTRPRTDVRPDGGAADAAAAAASRVNREDLDAAKARRAAAEATLAELDLAEREGTLVNAVDVEVHLVNVFAECRTKLLSVAAAARQQDPTLTVEQVALVERLIREACEALTVSPAEPGEGDDREPG